MGGHAVAYDGRPRATKDLDVLVELTADNAGRVLAALRDFFGGAHLGYSVDDLTNPNCVIRLGVAPVRIDLISALTGGPSFDEAWRNRVEAHFGKVQTTYVGLHDLIRAKEAAGRPQDRADVGTLRRVLSTESRSRRKL